MDHAMDHAMSHACPAKYIGNAGEGRKTTHTIYTTLGIPTRLKARVIAINSKSVVIITQFLTPDKTSCRLILIYLCTTLFIHLVVCFYIFPCLLF